jgi:uncharacterized protein (DUF2141 family)
VLRFVVRLPKARKAKGDVYCGLFDRSGWPWEPMDFEARAATAQSVTCEFDGLAPGKYALGAFLDENANRDLDRNWLGMPKEPWVLSGNVRLTLPVPPAFGDVSFDYPGGTVVIKAELKG